MSKRKAGPATTTGTAPDKQPYSPELARVARALVQVASRRRKSRPG